MQHVFTPLRRALCAWAVIATLVTGVLSMTAAPAHAAPKGLIRDAEIEAILRAYSDPIFQAAGLTPSSISIYIVNDPAINAFVMGGSNVFLNTGLIMASETPDMLLGVIAHETGHISGGHLVRTSGELESAQLRTMLGYLLGAAAMAGGSGEVGAAVMTANHHATLRGLFRFTRANEQAADQSAITILDQLGISANGMVELFEVLRRQEYRKMGSDGDPYTRTHPLSKERINHIRNHVKQSDIPAGQVPELFKTLHERMQGKLEGFLEDPARVLSRHEDDDTSLRARYARAVAYHRLADMERAIEEMDALIAEKPEDPYFHELKGQILFESGRLEEAQKAYQKAIDILPRNPLVRTELARVQLARNQSDDAAKAIGHLEYATSADKRNPHAWRLLATAYGREGQMGQSHLALAEEAILLNRPEDALQQLGMAKSHIEIGSAANLRADDLRKAATKLQKDLKDRQ